MWSDYTWIVVTGCLAAFFTAYGIGANDVANAFGSSVAARTLTMRQALLIASVCEFGGSVLLGGEVTRTVASGIAKLVSFDREPEMYMYGMLCAMVSSGTWLIVATYLELPVSTTHAIAGAVMGFAFVYGGPSAVVWLEPQDSFPYMKGMVPIIVSWFISPLLSALASSLLFFVVRIAILRRENSLEITFWVLPALVMFTVFINSYFVIYKGANKEIDWSSNKCAWISACIAAGCTLLTVLIGMPLVRQYVYKDMETRRRLQLSELESHMKVSERPSRMNTARISGSNHSPGDGCGFQRPPSQSTRSQGGGSGARATGNGAPAAAAAAALSPSHTAPGFTSPFVDYKSPSVHRQQQGGRPSGPAASPAGAPRSPYGSFSRTPAAAAASGGPAAGGPERQGSRQLAPPQGALPPPPPPAPQENGTTASGQATDGGGGGVVEAEELPARTSVRQQRQQQQLREGEQREGSGAEAVADDPLSGAQAGGGPPTPSQVGRGAGGGTGSAVHAAAQPHTPEVQQQWQQQQQGWNQQQQGWNQQQLDPAQQLTWEQQQQWRQQEYWQAQQQGWNQQQWAQAGQQQWLGAQQHQQQQWQGGQQYQQQQWQQQQQQQQQHRQQRWVQWQQPPHANNYQAGQNDMGQQQHGTGNTYSGLTMSYAAGSRQQLAQPGPIAESLEWGRKSSAPDADLHTKDTATDGTPEFEDATAAAAAGQADHGGNVHWQNTFDQLKAIVLRGTNNNVHEAIVADPVTQRIHAHAEVFDPATEDAFKYLQVVTAICDSFSHGANDVANSVGPFTAIWYIYRNQRIDYMADLPVWILVLGGAGIVVGLATYGYNIIRAIGIRFSVITPSRGFCIELSTAMVVAVASKYGLPISTTHCQVGATAGMGLMEGSSGLHWRLALQFFVGWVVTMLITGLLSAALFSAGAFAPCIQQGRAIMHYEDALIDLSTRIDLLLNRTNYAARVDPATWGNFSAALNETLYDNLRKMQLARVPGSSTSARPVQQIDEGELLAFVNRTVFTYYNNSLPYIGGMAATGQVLPRRP